MKKDLHHIVPKQHKNPSDEERYNLLEYALNEVNRLEDFKAVISELSPPEDILSINVEKKFKNKSVGIVGGGLSSMAAAFELRKRGFNVTIFEAEEERIGGRVYTYYFNKKKNLYGELGAMRIPISHECTWKYINQFGLNTRPFVNDNENALIYVRNLRIKNDSKGLNVKRYIYPVFNMKKIEQKFSFFELTEIGFSTPLLYVHTEERRECLQIKEDYSEGISKWFSLTELQTLKELSLSIGAIQCIGAVESHFGALYNFSTSEMFQDEYSMNFSFAYEIEGGTSMLPYAFYKSLNEEYPEQYAHIPKENIGNCTWLMGAKVKEIIFNEPSNMVQLKTQDKSMDFDYVICAVPIPCIREIKVTPRVSSKKITAIRDINYINSFKAIFLCKKRFWEEGIEFDPIVGGSSNTDLSISTIWYPSDHALKIDHKDKSERCLYLGSIFDKWEIHKDKKTSERGVLIAAYAHTSDADRLGALSEHERFELIKRQVEEVHGLPVGYMDYMVEDYKFMYWRDNPNSLGGFCHYCSEQKIDLSYWTSTSEYGGRLYFAGEHICSSHGWMQSAIQSGLIAANEIVKANT